MRSSTARREKESESNMIQFIGFEVLSKLHMIGIRAVSARFGLDGRGLDDGKVRCAEYKSTANLFK